jgi:hypothetical protein
LLALGSSDTPERKLSEFHHGATVPVRVVLTLRHVTYDLLRRVTCQIDFWRAILLQVSAVRGEANKQQIQETASGPAGCVISTPN